MAPLLRWFDPVAGDYVDAPLQLANIQNGTPTAPFTLELWNDKDAAGADLAEYLRLHVLGRHTGDTVWLASGLSVLDLRGLELRIAAGIGIEVEAGAWVGVGSGAELELPDLPAQTAVAIEWRVHLPGGAGTDDVEIRAEVHSAAAIAAPGGLSGAVGDGILAMDTNATWIEHMSGRIEPNAPADDAVQLPHIAWRYRGRPWAVLAQSVTLSGDDSAGDPLAAGEAYAAAVTLGAGTVTVAKGIKAASPLNEDDHPSPPAGEILLAWITRDDLGTIEASDITEVALPQGYALLETDGLDVTLGPGSALVAQHYVKSGRPQTVALPATSLTTVGLLPDGSVALVDDGSAPPTGFAALHALETDALSVTKHDDVRRWLGRESHIVSLTIANPSVGAVAVWANPLDRPLDVAAHRPITAALHGLPPAGQTGDWLIEIETLVEGGVWTSLFPTGTTLPTLATEGQLTDHEAIPEIRQLPARGLVRARIISLPSPGPHEGITIALNTLS